MDRSGDGDRVRAWYTSPTAAARNPSGASQLEPYQLARIKAMAMDMSNVFIAVAEEAVADIATGTT